MNLVFSLCFRMIRREVWIPPVIWISGLNCRRCLPEWNRDMVVINYGPEVNSLGSARQQVQSYDLEKRGKWDYIWSFCLTFSIVPFECNPNFMNRTHTSSENLGFACDCTCSVHICYVDLWAGRFQAFEIAHRMDRNSTARGVRQFKTSLLQRLEQVLTHLKRTYLGTWNVLTNIIKEYNVLSCHHIHIEFDLKGFHTLIPWSNGSNAVIFPFPQGGVLCLWCLHMFYLSSLNYQL